MTIIAKYPIIVTLAVGFVFSALVLFAIVERSMAPRGWWAVSFAEPSGASMDVVIENYEKSEAFSYEVILGDDVMETGTLTIPSLSQKVLSVSPDSSQQKRVTVRVTRETSHGQKETKEVYKNF